jgi:hypothetical protein
MVAIAYAGRGLTDMTFNQSAIAAGAVAVEWQYATRADFQYCIAPLVRVGTGTTLTFLGLNRSQTYYFRAREVMSDNTVKSWSPIKGATTLAGTDTVYTPGVQIQPAIIVVPQRPSLWGGEGIVAGYPVENLGVPSPIAAARLVPAADPYFFYIETNGQPIDTIALLDTNFPENTTIRFAGGNTPQKAAGVSPDTITAFAPFRATPNLRGRRGYHSITRLTTPLTDRYVGVLIYGDRPPGQLAHITHAVFGQARVLKNYSDRSDQVVDLGSFERQRDGSPDAVSGFRMKKVDFTISAMTETQRETQLGDLGMAIGTSEPALIIPNTKAGPYLHDRMLYGNITSRRGTDANMRFEETFSVESIIN